MADELALGRLKETLTPMVALGMDEMMNDLLATLEAALPRTNAEAGAPIAKVVMPLYALGMRHFKEQVSNRLQALITEREFEEALASLPSPPTSAPGIPT